MGPHARLITIDDHRCPSIERQVGGRLDVAVGRAGVRTFQRERLNRRLARAQNQTHPLGDLITIHELDHERMPPVSTVVEPDRVNSHIHLEMDGVRCWPGDRREEADAIRLAVDARRRVGRMDHPQSRARPRRRCHTPAARLYAATPRQVIFWDAHFLVRQRPTRSPLFVMRIATTAFECSHEQGPRRQLSRLPLCYESAILRIPLFGQLGLHREMGRTSHVFPCTGAELGIGVYCGVLQSRRYSPVVSKVTEAAVPSPPLQASRDSGKGRDALSGYLEMQKRSGDTFSDASRDAGKPSDRGSQHLVSRPRLSLLGPSNRRRTRAVPIRPGRPHWHETGTERFTQGSEIEANGAAVRLIRDGDSDDDAIVDAGFRSVRG